MPTTCWCIGAYPDFPSFTIDVDDGTNDDTITVAAGDYYPVHGTSSLSLGNAIASAINAQHTTLSDVTFSITASGRVQFKSTGETTFSIDFSVSTGGIIARDTLGYTGNVSGAHTHVAPTVSPLFWSPGKTESPVDAPLGVVGQKVRDAVRGQAATSVMKGRTFNSYRVNRFWWRFVANDRGWTSSEANGEYYTFFDQVLSMLRQFILWRSISEDTSDTSTIITLTTSLGPYKFTGDPRKWDLRRELKNVDKLHRIEFPVVQVAEFS